MKIERKEKKKPDGILRLFLRATFFVKQVIDILTFPCA